jgi:hypothetical protein
MLKTQTLFLRKNPNNLLKTTQLRFQVRVLLFSRERRAELAIKNELPNHPQTRMMTMLQVLFSQKRKSESAQKTRRLRRKNKKKPSDQSKKSKKGHKKDGSNSDIEIVEKSQETPEKELGKLIQ